MTICLIRGGAKFRGRIPNRQLQHTLLRGWTSSSSGCLNATADAASAAPAVGAQPASSAGSAGGNVSSISTIRTAIPAQGLLPSAARRSGVALAAVLCNSRWRAAIGLVAYGVSFPRHFLVKVGGVGRAEVVIDPLTGESAQPGGAGRNGCRTSARALRGGRGFDAPLDLTLLMPATPRGVCPRAHAATCATSKDIHHQTAEEDWPRCAAVLDQLIVLRPRPGEHQRDREQL